MCYTKLTLENQNASLAAVAFVCQMSKKDYNLLYSVTSLFLNRIKFGLYCKHEEKLHKAGYFF